MSFKPNVRGGSKLCKCGEPRAPGGRYCHGCKAAYMRNWLKQPGRGYKHFTPEQKLKADARSIVHMAVRRGKLKKEPCQHSGLGGQRCNAEKVECHLEDYTKPLQVQWLCRPHHKIVDDIKRIHDRAK